MSVGFVATLIGRAVIQILTIGGPLLGLSLLVGLTISIFQATTSLQEQTLTFVPKIIIVLGSLIILSSWIINSMINFTMNLFGLIHSMVQ